MHNAIEVPNRAASILDGLGNLTADLESLYKDLHAHPELSMQETRTSSLAAQRLHAAGCEVLAGVGKTGVVGVLRNGAGPTVMLRADMDALPVREATGVPYASSVTGTGSDGETVPVMHACGHDMHVAWLVGASTLMAQNRDAWRGTLIAVFQPAEETGAGARGMIDDGLLERLPRPDVILGQHVIPAPAGTVAHRAGTIMAAADSFQIRLFGRGAHGSRPHASVDPIVMAAATVLRLQGIVSREVAPTEVAVVTVGSLHAGTKENIIPDEAILKINVRSFDADVRGHALTAIDRIVKAEAMASSAPRAPEITPINNFPLTCNDADATARVAEAFLAHFPAERVSEAPMVTGSEDFGLFGTAWGVPSVFWFVGGTDPEIFARLKAEGRLNELPINHSSHFLPVIHPTLETGVETLIVASQAWLATKI